MKWFAILFCSGPCFVVTLHHDPSSCVDLHSMAYSFIELDKAVVHVATHSSTLAWKIPWTEEPGELQSMGSKRVGYD